MITDVVLDEEDFLQQFPGSDQYSADGLGFEDWWAEGDVLPEPGQPVDIAAMFNSASGA